LLSGVVENSINIFSGGFRVASGLFFEKAPFSIDYNSNPLLYEDFIFLLLHKNLIQISVFALVLATILIKKVFMKKGLILLPLAAVIMYYVLSSSSSGPSLNGTGATGVAGCSCHSPSHSTGIAVTITLDSAGIPITSYTPGNTYTVKITGTNNSYAGLGHFGFQMTAVKASGAGTGSATYTGSLATSGLPTGCWNTTFAGIHVVEHNTSLLATTGAGGIGTTYSESIQWTAPAAGTGNVVLYGVINAVNGDGSASALDHWNTAAPDTIHESIPVAAISGSSTVCVGGTTTLTDASVGGTWASGNPVIATVGSASGVVYGVSAGVVNITYTTGTGSSIKSITVNGLPSAGTVTGSPSMYAGSTVTFLDTVVGGSWSSSNPAVATVNSAGVVFGVGSGVVNISYSVSGTCGTSVAYSAPLSVLPAVTAGTITGPDSVCTAASITVSDSVSSGVWSLTNTHASIVPVSGGALVTGVSAGTDTVLYIVGGTSTAYKIITVRSLPASPAGITGPLSSLCVGSVLTLSDITGGGIWSSSNSTIATVSGSGLVSGVSAGTTAISYTVSNSCGSAVAAVSITVNATGGSVAAVSGPGTVCVGSTVTLSDTTSGGTWSATNSNASVSGTGVVTGNAYGTDTIHYTVSGSCGTLTAAKVISINMAPSLAGAISGLPNVCIGNSVTLSDSTTGGAWTSGGWSVSNAAASVSFSSGNSAVITGVSTGIDTVTFSISNVCGTASAQKVLAVITTPSAGTITGTSPLCIGSVATFSDTVSGAVWISSNPAVATVSSGGVVTGLSVGTVTLTVSKTGTCGTAYAYSSPLSVITVPAAGTITGGSTTLCSGAVSTFSDSVSGGVWSAANGYVAVSSTGVVTAGLSNGTDTVSYSVSNSCGTASAIKIVTVTNTALAGTITGPSVVCVGDTSAMFDGVSGGIFSTTNAAATCSATGIIVGVFVGLDTVKYTVTGSCGTAVASKPISVNASPAAIAGVGHICAGGSVTLTDATSGGTWSSSATTIATVTPTGTTVLAGGVASGTTIISYSVSGCFALLPITVSPLPVAGTIFGSSTVCVGWDITLSDSVSGGTWSATNTRAFVAPGGIVQGEGPGVDTIQYTVSNSCGFAVASATVTVNPVSYVSAIYGSASVCAGANITLSDSTAGGTWYAINGNAFVDSSGIVFGVAPGTDTIGYSVATSCGTNTVYHIITVNPAGYVSSISGSPYVCVAGTTTLTDSGAAGVWTVSNGHASVSGGIVTGISAGIDTVYYATSGVCGSYSAYKVVTINTAPYAGTLTGATSLCVGGTTTLTDSIGGGTGSISNSNVSISSGGIATGVYPGLDTITYTVNNGCGIASSSLVITVSALPNAGTISGITNICNGGTATFSDSVSGGTWSVTNSHLSISSGGVATAASIGTDTVLYTVSGACGTASAQKIVYVIPSPHAGIISGLALNCTGTTVTLTDPLAGGTWSVTNSNATVIAPGIINCINSGTDTVKYTVSSTCGTAVAKYTITINPTPAGISGSTGLCTGSVTTLSDATTGGTWSSGDTSIATVSTAGTVTGVNAGATSVTYALPTGCFSLVGVLVNALPSVPSISGPGSVCAGSSVLMTDSLSGGTWSVSNGNATISSSGYLHGVSIGYDTVNYSYSNFCGTTTVHKGIVIDAAGAGAGVISGVANTCVGVPVTLSDTVSGGSWSYYGSGATLSSSGVLYPSTSGLDTVMYSTSTLCGITTSRKIITVNSAPSVSAITGPVAICYGTPATFADATVGGSWTVANTSSTISPSGILTEAATGGSETISYTVSNSCGTTHVTTNVSIDSMPLAGVIFGSSVVCVGATITLNDTTIRTSSTGTVTPIFTNGTASLSDLPSGMGGLVTGITSGIDTLILNVVNACGTATTTKVVTVNPSPDAGTITGVTSVCAGYSTTLADSAAGGTWSVVNSNATVTSGVVLGLSTGTDTVKYTVINSCGTAVASTNLLITATASAGTITGAGSVCAGSSITLANAVSGGTWSVSNADASISSGGVVTGYIAGTDTVRYSVSTSCGAATVSKIITVNAVPGPITGATTVCSGVPVSLSDLSGGGSWSSSNTAMATVTASGVVHALQRGVVNISYILPSGCSTGVTVTTNVAPVAGTVSGPSLVCVGSVITMTDSVSGGSWSTVFSHASVSSGGVVTGTINGVDTVKYTVVNACGSSTAVKTITVNPSSITIAAISGTSALCAGTTATFTDATSGGAWSSIRSNATISSSGVLTALTDGVDTLVYGIASSCGTAVATKIVTVNAIPSPGTIFGASAICLGGTASLTDSITGGTWRMMNANATFTTIDSGIAVTGISLGNDTVIYKVSNGCGTDSTIFPLTIITVPSAGALTGPGSVCVFDTISLTVSVAGGTDSMSNTTASAFNSGAHTLAVIGTTAGVDTLVYTVSNICGATLVTKIITVNPLPTVPAISGTLSTCVSATATLSDTASGGVWSHVSTNTMLAPTGTSASVTGITQGLDTIHYSMTNGCGTTVVTAVFTVNPLPNAGTVSGADSLCAGSTDTMTSSISGGYWNLINSNAVFTSTGVVLGVHSGYDTVKYIYTNVCGADTARRVLKIMAVPAAGIIVGTDSVCPGSVVAFSDTVNLWGAAAYWSVINSNASIAPSGTVTGVAAGVDSIKYTVSNFCGISTAVKSITILPMPIVGAISGMDSVCVAATATLADSVLGGTWSVANGNLSIVSGVILGIHAGLDTAVYAVHNSCGTIAARKPIVVKALADSGVITGAAQVCRGSAAVLSETAAIGTWSVANANASVSAAGLVTGNAVGVDTVFFTASNSCGTAVASFAISVITVPSVTPFICADTICLGNHITMSDSVAGGNWVASNANITFSDSVLTAAGFGWDSIKYVLTNICGSDSTFRSVFVNSVPSSGIITGADTVCIGSSITLSASVIGGSWSNLYGNVSVAAGAVTGVHRGLDSVVYAVGNMCGTTHAQFGLYVDSLPQKPVLTGNNFVCVGRKADTLSANIAGGIWSLSNSKISVVNGILTGVTPGLDTVTYWVHNECGNNSASLVVRVPTAHECDSMAAVPDMAANQQQISVFPNPTSGAFTVVLPATVTNCELAILDMYGRIVYSEVVKTQGTGNASVSLPGIARGNYLVRVHTESGVLMEKITVW
jgi:Secretion system C-terminal sorting domain/Bacterial Ig-like domain (group 2)